MARSDDERREFIDAHMQFDCVQRLSRAGRWTGRDLVLLPVAQDGQEVVRAPVGLVSRLPGERIEEDGIQRDIFMAYRHEKTWNGQGEMVITRADDIYV